MSWHGNYVPPPGRDHLFRVLAFLSHLTLMNMCNYLSLGLLLIVLWQMHSEYALDVLQDENNLAHLEILVGNE